MALGACPMLDFALGAASLAVRRNELDETVLMMGDQDGEGEWRG